MAATPQVKALHDSTITTLASVDHGRRVGPDPERFP